MAYMSESIERISMMDKSKIIVFDLETTGLDVNNDEIVQIAIINGKGKKLFESYIKPEAPDWDKGTQKLNGITPKTVKNAPSFAEVQSKVQRAFDNADLILGYNLRKFDLPMIKRYGISYNAAVRDVMWEARDYLNLKGGYYEDSISLETVAKHFRYKYKAHDALEDCKATLYIFDKIISDDSFSDASESEFEDAIVYSAEYTPPKKSSKRGKIFLFALILLIVGLLGTIISARALSGGFGVDHVFNLANFSNYVFDGFAALVLIGLLIIVFVIRSIIRSRR